MKKNLILVVLLSWTSHAYCQNEKLQSSFKSSYEREDSGDFLKAMETLKVVYDEKSYEINLRLGWVSYENKLYSESIKYYEKAIGLMPYSIEAKLGLVYPASLLGNWDQVVAQYKKILEIDPQNTVANYRMGLIEYNRKNYASAFKFFEKVVNLYPFGYDALIMFAWSNFQMGKTREAKVLFNKVLLLSPSDASALEGLSLIK